MAKETIISGLPSVGFSALKTAALNLMLAWHDQYNIVSLAPVSSFSGQLDPLRWQRFSEIAENTEQFNIQFIEELNSIDSSVPQALTVPYPVLHSLGSDFDLPLLEKNVLLYGEPNIAFVDFINTDFPSDVDERTELFKTIVTFSAWAKETLNDNNIVNVESVPVGVDASLFYPHAKAGFYGNKKVIFSAGDDSFAGGYDFVVKSFAEYLKINPETVLITSWARRYKEELAETEVKNKIIELGSIPYALIPYIIREADVALFPSRCAYSNLWEKMCMACEIPVVLSDNTAHREIINGNNSVVLGTQDPMSEDKYTGWSESSVEEIVASLEFIFTNNDKALKIAEQGKETALLRSWQNYADDVQKIIA